MNIVKADALSIPLRDSVAQCVVTSPPYPGQRVYGTNDNEIGREGTVNAFCESLVEVCKEIRRILVDDGLLWLNLGDKANGSGGAGGDYSKTGSKRGRPKYGSFHDKSFERIQFLDIPGKTVAALQSDKWRLRSYVVWNKAQESREDLKHVNRPRVSHETILMLAPTRVRPQFFGDRLIETGSVWTFPPAQLEGKNHLAPFPDELPRRCILASTEPNDLVVDPFVGSGTTSKVASSLGRRSVGFDLYAGE